jgi:Zn-dependent peptidase ImmA (M78 family)
MAKSPPALLTPASLRWARESVGYELDAAARRIGVGADKLKQAENGEGYLTLRQAEAAARCYERPLAALFLPHPPAQEPVEAQFRRLPGAPAPPWPHEMQALARRVRERQAAASELYDALDEVPPWAVLELKFVDDPVVLAERSRDATGIELTEQRSWRDPTGYRPLREWVDAVEALGVLVMQDGTMSVEEMRGFAATHSLVPAIVVNTNDDPRARAFTVVHELAHLLRDRTGTEHDPPTLAVERWCNDFATNLLMPRDEFAAAFRRGAGSLLRVVDGLALDYGVTPHAAAVRVARLQLAPQDSVDEVLEAIAERAASKGEGGGGNYYSTMVGRLGPAFIELVLSAVDRQALSYPAASGLLGVKVNNFAKLRDRTADRAIGR